MGQTDDRAKAEPRPPGRIRAAWRVLKGEAVVPDQILAQWAEYQAIFGDLLQRWSAAQARQVKLDKARLKALESEAGPPTRDVPTDPGSVKARLRSIAAQRLGLGPQVGVQVVPPQQQRNLFNGDGDS